MKKLENLNDDLFQALDLEESKQLTGGAAGTSHGTSEASYGPDGPDIKVDVRIDF